MATAKVELPDSILDKAAQTKIRALQKQVKNLEARLNTAEKKLREANYTVSVANKVQQAFKEFTAVLAEELNLEGYDPYRRSW